MSSWRTNPNYLTSTPLWIVFQGDLQQMTDRLLGVVSRCVHLPQLLLINEYSPVIFINQPLSVMLKKPSSPSPPVVQSPTSTDPPPSLLFRLAPQLRPPPRAATPPSSTHPLETLQSPRDTTLSISLMIAMPTPPTTKSHSSSEDTFPPVQVGVARLTIPQGWVTDAKSS